MDHGKVAYQSEGPKSKEWKVVSLLSLKKEQTLWLIEFWKIWRGSPGYDSIMRKLHFKMKVLSQETRKL